MVNLLIPRRRFDASRPEMIDRTDNDPTLLAEDLQNLRTINRYFGGISAVRSNILTFFKHDASRKTFEFLDLATGAADLPIEILRVAENLERDVRILAVDKNPQILEMAQERTGAYRKITLEQRDLLQLGYEDKSFDIVLCSLAIHHFSRSDAVTILREMNRLSRLGFIVSDLNRSWIGAWTAWLYTHATTRNPLTLNDSYLSVLRAFTPDELRQMAIEAGIEKFEIMIRPFFRLILVGSG